MRTNELKELVEKLEQKYSNAGVNVFFDIIDDNLYVRKNVRFVIDDNAGYEPINKVECEEYYTQCYYAPIYSVRRLIKEIGNYISGKSHSRLNIISESFGEYRSELTYSAYYYANLADSLGDNRYLKRAKEYAEIDIRLSELRDSCFLVKTRGNYYVIPRNKVRRCINMNEITGLIKKALPFEKEVCTVR